MTQHPGVQQADLSALPTVKSIRSRGFVRVLVNSYTPGFSSRDTLNGPRYGFEIDLARSLATSIFGQVADVESHIDFVETETDRRIDMLVDREVDMIISNLTDTTERRRKIDFAGRYISMRYAPLLGPYSPAVRDVSDLAGLRVAVEAGSIDEKFLERTASRAELVPMTSPSEWIAALVTGRVQAFWGDTAVDPAYVLQPQTKIRQGKLRAGVGHSAIGVNKEAGDLRRFVDDFVNELRVSGRLTDSLRRWGVGTSQLREA